MKTLNRPTAPSPLAQADLSALCATARSIACSEPNAHGTEREQLIASLHTVDLDLERLSIREAVGALDSSDDAELERCRRELARLAAQWPGGGGDAVRVER